MVVWGAKLKRVLPSVDLGEGFGDGGVYRRKKIGVTGRKRLGKTYIPLPKYNLDINFQ